LNLSNTEFYYNNFPHIVIFFLRYLRYTNRFFLTFHSTHLQPYRRNGENILSPGNELGELKTNRPLLLFLSSENIGNEPTQHLRSLQVAFVISQIWSESCW